jgi:hypothetical protein
MPEKAPRRIVGTEYLKSASLSPEQRSVVVDQFYDVYRESVRGYSREEFEAKVFGPEEFRMALCYGPRGEFAGGVCARIERFEHRGRPHAVFCASVYFRLGYRGGAASARFGLREALRFKLRQPRTSLAYLTRSSSPAAYRLLASRMPRIYPSRKRATPAEVEALMLAHAARRPQYVPVGEDHWVVRSAATPCNASRLRKLERDPDVRFYLQRNPRFADGEALLVWLPLDVANVAGGLCRLLRERFRR